MTRMRVAAAAAETTTMIAISASGLSPVVGLASAGSSVELCASGVLLRVVSGT